MGRRDVFLLSILTFITAVAWIAFDVYHASVESTVSKEVEIELSPVTPNFDVAVIEKVKKRQNVDPLDSGGVSIVLPTQAPPSTSSGARVTPLPTGIGTTATQSGGP